MRLRRLPPKLKVLGYFHFAIVLISITPSVTDREPLISNTGSGIFVLQMDFQQIELFLAGRSREEIEGSDVSVKLFRILVRTVPILSYLASQDEGPLHTTGGPRCAGYTGT